MAYALGKRSLERLDRVHPDLVRVVERAITITAVDFTVLEGLRTMERQRELLASKASRTLKSRHLTGHAVDLGAYVSGEIRWDWPLYYNIGRAMRAAASAENIPLTWGGVWDRRMAGLGSDLETEVAFYIARFRKREGRSPLIDGPHFQLPWKDY